MVVNNNIGSAHVSHASRREDRTRDQLLSLTVNTILSQNQQISEPSSASIDLSKINEAKDKLIKQAENNELIFDEHLSANPAIRVLKDDMDFTSAVYGKFLQHQSPNLLSVKALMKSKFRLEMELAKHLLEKFAACSDFGVVEFLLQGGVDPARCSSDVLCSAVKSGVLKNLRMLLSYGLDVKYENIKHPQHTPMHEAALRGSIGMVNLLLDHGANVNIKNFSGKTPYDLAISYNKKGCADLIKSYTKLVKKAKTPEQLNDLRRTAIANNQKAHKNLNGDDAAKYLLGQSTLKRSRSKGSINSDMLFAKGAKSKSNTEMTTDDLERSESFNSSGSTLVESISGSVKSSVTSDEIDGNETLVATPTANFSYTDSPTLRSSATSVKSSRSGILFPSSKSSGSRYDDAMSTHSGVGSVISCRSGILSPSSQLSGSNYDDDAMSTYSNVGSVKSSRSGILSPSSQLSGSNYDDDAVSTHSSVGSVKSSRSGILSPSSQLSGSSYDDDAMSTHSSVGSVKSSRSGILSPSSQLSGINYDDDANSIDMRSDAGSTRSRLSAKSSISSLFSKLRFSN